MKTLLNALLALVSVPAVHAADPAAPGLGSEDLTTWKDGPDAAARYAAADWKLHWADEFETPGLPDPAKWDYETGMRRNQEAQFYTAGRPENARIEIGHLLITARKEPWEQAAYTSASLITKGRFAMDSGKIEIRAKVPSGRGVWPALWTLGLDPEGRRWPACGEIDLMEFVGWQPDRFHFTVHTGAFNHVKRTQKGTNRKLQNPSADFHRFGLLWSTQRLEWFLNGEKVFEFRNSGKGNDEWPFDHPHYLLINLAIGGTWGGAKGIDDSLFPAEFLIDYVRVWKAPN